MAENSKIEWTHHTFNPWVGCTKVSPACDHCYAESWAKRSGSPELWKGARRQTKPSYWRQPLKWNANAAMLGERHRVFCASLADVWDNQVPMQWRRELFDLICKTQNLDWLLLTKRPQNIRKMVEEVFSGFFPWPWPNVWLGTTAENDEELDRRWPHLASVPAVVRFLSMEPLLKRTSLTDASPDWVIVGGESGPQARLMSPDWARNLRDECAGRGIAFFMKQMTHKAPIPPDLMVRQFPTPPSPQADER